MGLRVCGSAYGTVCSLFAGWVVKKNLPALFCFAQVPKDTPWYHRHASQMVMSGFLPFSAIYIELHYIFASVWGHQIYTLFGILILAFLLLLVVCSFITVRGGEKEGTSNSSSIP